MTTQGADLVIVHPESPTLTPTHRAAANFIPAEPTWDPATGTQPKGPPTARPSQTATATRIAPAARPGANTAWNVHAWNPEGRPVISGRALTYVGVGGFAGAIVLSGLAVWVQAAKRRKEGAAKSK